MGQEVFSGNTIMVSGTCVDFLDLWEREAKRTGFTWRDSPSNYDYMARISPNRKITSVQLFHATDDGKYDFVGAGTAIRSPLDNYNQEAGIRIAMSRALHSIHYHRKG